MSILRARQLGKTYRAGSRGAVRALGDVTLEIPEGAFTVLTGPSGSGKTTLLALLGGLERPSSGQAFFASRDLGACSGMELARLRRRMGFVFQDFALIGGLSAWENVAYPLVARGVPAGERSRLARRWLGPLRLGGPPAARPRRPAGGGRPRAGPAPAPAGAPPGRPGPPP